jgi:hypothetical protein
MGIMGNNSTILIATLGLVALMASPVAAKPRCPEGRTQAGECVDPDVAITARVFAIVESQQKLSYTAPPNLPSEDYDYANVRNHHETNNLFTRPEVIRNTTRRP